MTPDDIFFFAEPDVLKEAARGLLILASLSKAAGEPPNLTKRLVGRAGELIERSAGDVERLN